MNFFNIPKIFAVSVLASSALYFAACSEQNPIESANDDNIGYYDINKGLDQLKSDIDNVQKAKSSDSQPVSSSSSTKASSSSSAKETSSSSSQEVPASSETVVEPEDFLTQNMLINITLQSFEQKETSADMPNYRPTLRFVANYSTDGVDSYSNKSAYLLNDSTKYEWKDSTFAWTGTKNASIKVSKGVDKIVLCVELQNRYLNDEEEDGEIVGDNCITKDKIGKIKEGTTFTVNIDGTNTIQYEWNLVPNK